MHGMNNKKKTLSFFNDDILNLVWNWKWLRPWSLIISSSSSGGGGHSSSGGGHSSSGGGGGRCTSCSGNGSSSGSSSGTDRHNTRRHCTCAQWHDYLQSALFERM